MISKTFNISFESAINECKNTLENTDFKIVSINLKDGIINVKKNGGFFSYGHNVLIHLDKIGSEQIKISITSKSIGIQIIDWGTNDENENEIMEKLLNIIE